MPCQNRRMPDAGELAFSTAHSLRARVVISYLEDEAGEGPGTGQGTEMGAVLRLRLEGFLGAVVSAFSKNTA